MGSIAREAQAIRRLVEQSKSKHIAQESLALEEVAERLSITRTQLRGLVRLGHLRTFSVGRELFIPLYLVEAYLARSSR